jgi:predicted Zn-dependent protease
VSAVVCGVCLSAGAQIIPMPIPDAPQAGGGKIGKVITATHPDAPSTPTTLGKQQSADAREAGSNNVMAKPESDEGALGSLPEVTPMFTETAAGDAFHYTGDKKYDVTKIGDRGIGGGMNFYSTDKEIMLGRELSDDVEKNAKLFRDPQIEEYVNRLAQNLVRNSDAKVPFTVKIIDSDEVNAFALPGGFFYINTGLLQAVDSEAELAGVMAHEIAHVAARHATKRATKQEIWNLASIPLVFVGGPAGMAVRQFVGVAVPMSFLKFSRDNEREADLLGMEYQYAAGYDPAAVVNFFEKLQAKEKKKQSFIARAFSTHPMNADRMKRCEKEISTMLPPEEQYLVTTSEFEEMKARLDSMTSGHLQIGSAGETGRPELRKKQ